MTPQLRVHGGPDALGVPRFDFSTNSNACGPCPGALAAVQQADATRYPDSSYTALRAKLAAFHGVDTARVVLAGSASEFIFRITAWVAQRSGPKRVRKVCVPVHGFGDYTQAAQAWGLAPTSDASKAQLVWACEPSSPLGGAHTAWPDGVLHASTVVDDQVPVVLDCAYAPLRLEGEPSLDARQVNRVWQLWSPNKSMGLTGVRAAYAIAPAGGEDAVWALDALAPSWPLGAHGEALLQAWVQPEVQNWLTESLHTLRRWKAMQIDMLQGQGWTCLPSEANFFCARPQATEGWDAMLEQLRVAGIKLRDTASFGLPGHARLGVQPPVAQDALKMALQSSNATTATGARA